MNQKTYQVLLNDSNEVSYEWKGLDIPDIVREKYSIFPEDLEGSGKEELPITFRNHLHNLLITLRVKPEIDTIESLSCQFVKMQCGASFLRIKDPEGFITWIKQSTEGNDYTTQELEVLHYAAINQR
jgi:hypothetical protein